MILESQLEKLFDRLPVFYKKLHPNRTHHGKYIEGEPFDYILFREGSIFCFDAKETKKNVLYASQIPIHQFNDLLKAEKHGAIVFFIIYFSTQKKLKFVHPKTILDDKKATIKSVECENDLKNLLLNFFKF